MSSAKSWNPARSSSAGAPSAAPRAKRTVRSPSRQVKSWSESLIAGQAYGLTHRAILQPVRILVLGGTRFVGRAVATEALARGHEVSLFTRGRHDAGALPEAEHLHGDRDGDLRALEGRTWDVAIDSSGYVPRVVGASAGLLAPAVERYVFVSSVSVYADVREPGVHEGSPVEKPSAPDSEDVQADYGALKAACERAVEDALPGRTLNVRSGLVVGPGDPTGRFTYWIARLARGGAVLAPEPPEQPVQFIDARDLGAWVVASASGGLTGTFNAVGPAEPLTMAALLDAVRDATGAQAAWCGCPRSCWPQPASAPGWTCRLARAGLEPALAGAHGIDNRARSPPDSLPSARGDRARHAGVARQSPPLGPGAPTEPPPGLDPAASRRSSRASRARRGRRGARA